jgi:enediyne polyketide synthase
MREAGVRHLYLRADVTDADAVKRAVRAAESQTGPITALLHGAGVNRPLLLEALDVPSLEATLDPKVRGFQNLVAAVDRSRLRLLVGFGSVIGRVGMRGEADYALANACLTLLVEEFQRRHPSCRCLALETSVWSGIGMGERLGRVEALAREGITPIPPARGVELFLRLLRREAGPTTVVVSGRMGARPPMRLLGPDIPVLRFLERPLLHYPGVEVVAESEVSTATDPYLLDHVLDGQILLPAVLGLEAMAQAAQAVLGAAFRPGFENVRFDHPVIVPAEGAIRLRLAAERRGRDAVDVVLRSSETGYQVDHFRCRCRPMTDDGGPLPDLPGPSALALDPARDLYGGLLFQAGRFRRLTRYHRLTASHACAEVTPDGDRPWFSGYLPPTMVLGDPGARDACIHSIQGCLPHARLVPVGVDRLRTGRLEGPGPLTAQAREVWREGDTYCYDLEIRDASGRQHEAWEGLRLRRVGPARTGHWHETLLAPFVEWRLRELVPGSRVLVALERDGRAPRRLRSDRALRRAAGGNAALRHRGDGRPWFDPDLEVSAAHAGELTMVVAQAGPVSCDIQEARSPAGAEWTDLVGPAGATLAAVIAERAAEPFSVAATRVWAARECLKKAGRPSSAVITLRSSEGDGWACLSTPGATIATCVAPVAGVPDPLVLAVFVGDEGCGATSTVTRSASRTRTS